MTFTLKIKCDNAAFSGGNINLEIGRILEKTGKRIAQDELESGNLFDSNGNKVGSFKLI